MEKYREKHTIGGFSIETEETKIFKRTESNFYNIKFEEIEGKKPH